MGYYSKFNIYLSHINNNSKSDYDEIFNRLEEISDYDITNYTIVNRLHSSNWKWYSHNEDLKKLSKEFPDIRIRMERIGEEFPDGEIIIFENGKLKRYYMKIIFENDDGETIEYHG